MPSKDDSKLFANLFLKHCIVFEVKVLNSLTDVLRLMCEVQHQHHSCRTRIKGLIADNMEEKGKKRKYLFYEERERNSSLGLRALYLFVYCFLIIEIHIDYF